MAFVLAGLRWLRVAQREHYTADGASRFAMRWWASSLANAALVLIAGVGLVLAVRWPATGFATAFAAGVGPLGLGLRGRSAPLAWTRRLRTLAGVYLALGAAVVAGVGLAGHATTAAAAVAIGSPALVDIACRLTAPFERIWAGRYVSAARRRLSDVGPTVVAITGSYGKTSTKAALAQLAAGSFDVMASPASFNNRAGLARAINENLTDSTEVFVAEMGTYGPGEIAELCSWIRPDIATITAIGPVHLERFRSEDRILKAKSEILEHASTVVMPIDDPRLAAVATSCAENGKRVITCSARPADGEGSEGSPDQGNDPPGSADVTVIPSGGTWQVQAGEQVIWSGPELAVQPLNVACAVAIARALNVPDEAISERLGKLAPVSHRLEALESPTGVQVIDDTYNSNPAGARAALEALGRLGGGGTGEVRTGGGAGVVRTGGGAGEEARGKVVVVTPGMVELGRRQAAENADFAARAATVATHLVVVGRTNRRALLAGASAAEPAPPGASDGASDGTARLAEVVVVPNREAAVAWVRENTAGGDAVLYENDLPDHYP